MKIIESTYEILTPISEGGIAELQAIERAARTCYKSEARMSEDGESAKKLIARLIKSGHEAMLEHSQLSVRFICDRGVSHELVRHRVASFAQESTRYCKYNDGIVVVRPSSYDKWTENAQLYWENAMSLSEKAYFILLESGCSPQEARAVLPNSLKTEVVMTANYREWRHIFALRVAPDAHPDMVILMYPLLDELQVKIPIVFDNIE